ncbi:MAG: peptidyl-tRNA hydrolase Pth2 [Candidatus Odinarchaeia archaeon]
MSDFKFKQVIVIRSDLKMSKGKTAVQVAHAAVLAAESARLKFDKWWRDWINEGQKKVVVKVETLKDLIELKNKALEIGIPYALIEDRGLTELPPGTITCLGLGPAPEKVLDKLTSSLLLL